MIYGFDTDDHAAGTAALLIYATYRSRDRGRLKITPDLWGQVERFAKASAKRAKTLPQFVEALKPRLCCATISPRWMAVGLTGEIPLVAVHDESGALSYAIQVAEPPGGQREFLSRVFAEADHSAVIARLYKETAWCVLLVRDRLERERPIEAKLDITTGEDA